MGFMVQCWSAWVHCGTHNANGMDCDRECFLRLGKELGFEQRISHANPYCSNFRWHPSGLKLHHFHSKLNHSYFKLHHSGLKQQCCGFKLHYFYLKLHRSSLGPHHSCLKHHRVSCGCV
jgi:hypothetical protein